MKACINCGGTNYKQGEGDYKDYIKCEDCGMYALDKQSAKSNVILPDDPMDAMMCESCQ